MKIFFNILLALAPLVLVDAAKSDVIYNIRLNPKSEAALQWNQNVDITFDYKTSEASGIKVFAHPMNGDSLAANYSVSGSPLYPYGSGTGNKSFTITSGDVVVDKVRFQVYNSNQTLLILEFCVPVKFYFGEHAIYDIQLSPATYSSLRYYQFVDITLDYKTTQGGGVLIFAMPKIFLPSSATSVYSSSPIFPTGTGSISRIVTISDDTATVYGINFRMYDKNKTLVLLDFVMPVNYKYSSHAISNIVISPSTATGLLLNEYTNVSYLYNTPESSGVRISVTPFSNGTIAPNGIGSLTAILAIGAGTGTGRFTIPSGSITVDSVRIRMWNAATTLALLDWYVPVNLHFASSKITNFTFEPTSAAYFTNNEQVNISFDYTTSEAGGIKIITRPKSGSSFTPSSTSSASPLYTSGTGSGISSFTFTGGTTTVDSVCFQVYDATQTTLLDEFVVPVKFYFGSQPLTGITTNNSDIVKEFKLSQNYPNPFNPVTTITFSVGTYSHTSLRVFDMLGREITTLVNERKPTGSYQVQWNAKGMPSGVYFYRLSVVPSARRDLDPNNVRNGQAGSFTETKKLIIIK